MLMRQNKDRPLLLNKTEKIACKDFFDVIWEGPEVRISRCSKRAGDWLQIFNSDLIENGTRRLKELIKISKFTKFESYWFKHKGMV